MMIRNLVKSFLFTVIVLCGLSQTALAQMPDCIFNFNLTQAGGATQSFPTGSGYINLPAPSVPAAGGGTCTSWFVTYATTGVSTSISVALQNAPANGSQIVAGAWSNYTGTVNSGYSNPTTTLAGGQASFTNGAVSTPFVRIQITNFVDAGARVWGVVYGYKNGFSASRGGSSICNLTGGQTTGEVLTATDNSKGCNWQTVGGASVNAGTIANAWYIADTGTANAITGTTATAFPGAYADGLAVLVKAAATNSGATTININGLGVIPVVKRGSVALAAGNKLSGGDYLLVYNGTSAKFDMFNYAPTCADLSNSAPSCSVDTTNASNINSGILGVPQGGTGTSTPFVVNPQTGTYNLAASDFASFKTIVVNSASPFGITVVSSGTQPANGQWVRVIAYGAGFMTVLRNGQLLNGGTTSFGIPGAPDPQHPVSTYITSDGTNFELSTAFSNPMTGAGDLIYGAVGGSPQRLPAAVGILSNNGTTPSYFTAAQATAFLNIFTSSLQGLVPASGGGTTNFLRADGSWVAPPGGAPSLFTSYQFQSNAPLTGSSLYLQTVYPTSLFTLTQSGAGTSGSPFVDSVALASQSANLGFFSPNGGSGAPTFRGMVYTDFPSQGTNTVLGNILGGSAPPTALSQLQLTALINPFTSSLAGAVPGSGGGTVNFLRADGTWAAPPGGGGGGTGSAAALVTVPFSGTPTFTCPSASAGTVVDFEMSTAMSANITASMLAGCTTGSTLNFSFTQASSGGPYTVAMPTGFSQACQISPIVPTTTNMSFFWDGTTAQLIGCQTTGAGVSPEISAPSGNPPTGYEYLWEDATGLFPRAKNSAGTFFQMAKELSSGNPRCAGGANTADSVCTAAQVYGLWTGTGILRNDSSVATEVSGDGTTSGSNVLTVVKIHGTSVPTNSAADQVLLTTASATGSWASIPNCGSSTQALNYSTGSHAFGCQTLSGGGGTGGQVNYPVTQPLGIVNLGFATTTTTAVVNTTTPTTIIGQFVGRNAIPAGTMLPFTSGPKVIHIHVGGAVQTAGAVSVTFTVLLGGQTVIALSPAVPLATSAQGFSLDTDISITGLGTILTTSTLCGPFANVGGVDTNICNNSYASPSGFNFAANQTVDVQVTWGSASPSNQVSTILVAMYPTVSI